MRLTFMTMRAICLCAIAILTAPAVTSAQSTQPPAQAAKVPDDERKALEKINTVTGPAAKMQAADEYVKKFGKSPRRAKVASYISNEISNVQDSAERIKLTQSFIATFNQPEEVDLVKLTMIDALVKANKLDEAFAEAAKYLPRHPDDVLLQTQLAIIGAEQAQHQNVKFVQISREYGVKAIEAMETDKKPADMTAEAWQQYRGQWLPRLYQSQGVLLYLANDRPGAKERLEKAVGLDARDPSTLMMLGMMSDDEYQALAKQYNAEKAGPGKDAVLKQAFAKMDEVIDWFARAAAAAEGKPEYQAMHQQLMQNLQSYYSYRHNNSTDGLKELIEKYKKPAGQ